MASTLFGKTSIGCALGSVFCGLFLFISGHVLPQFTTESVLVPIQIISVFLVPTLSLIGLSFGIPGIRHDASPGLAKVGTWMNVFILIFSIIFFTFVSIASFEINEDGDIRIPEPAVEIE